MKIQWLHLSLHQLVFPDLPSSLHFDKTVSGKEKSAAKSNLIKYLNLLNASDFLLTQ